MVLVQDYQDHVQERSDRHFLNVIEFLSHLEQDFRSTLF